MTHNDLISMYLGHDDLIMYIGHGDLIIMYIGHHDPIKHSSSEFPYDVIRIPL